MLPLNLLYQRMYLQKPWSVVPKKEFQSLRKNNLSKKEGILVSNFINLNTLLSLSCRSPAKTSVLLPFLLNACASRDFIPDLIFYLHKDWETFSAIFSPVLQGLVQAMRQTGLDTEDHRQPLLVLSELCEIKVGSTRPICNLVNNLLLVLNFTNASFNTKSVT